MNSIKINHGKTLMIAHRGLSGLEKENTMQSFVCGGQHTYYGMECDIHPTSDNVLVVIHDSDTERVAGKSLIIEQSTYEQVKEVTLLDKFQNVNRSCIRIPLFEDYLECCIKYEKKAIVEIKNIFSKENIIQTIDIVKKYNYLENTVFISFYPQNLLMVKEIYPEAQCQFLSTTLSEEVVQGCFTYHMDVDVNYKAVESKDIIVEFHNHGLKMNVWTVDDPEVAKKLIEWGVDYITTNILE